MRIDFNKCREEVAGAQLRSCNRWCKREHVEANALNTWKLKEYIVIESRISFYSNNLDLLPPKPKFTFRIFFWGGGGGALPRGAMGLSAVCDCGIFLIINTYYFEEWG